MDKTAYKKRLLMPDMKLSLGRAAVRLGGLAGLDGKYTIVNINRTPHTPHSTIRIVRI